MSNASKTNSRKHPLNLKWERYPAGAHVQLFDGAIIMSVAQYRNRRGNVVWCAMQNLTLSAGGGALYMSDKKRDREDAIYDAELWLKDHMEKLLKAGSSESKPTSKRSARCSKAAGRV